MRTDEARAGRAAWVPWALLVAAVGWAVLRVAPGTIPDVAAAAARSAQWPQKDLPEFSAYVRTSPVGQVAYQLGGALGTWEYVLIHALAAVACVALLAWWLAREVPADRRWTARRLVVLSPVAAVLLVFLGAYDPFTVLGVAALLFAWTSGRRWALLLAGTYLGFQHFEQGLIVVTVSTIVALAIGPALGGGRRTPAWAYLGLLAGKLLLSLALLVATGDAVSGRGSYVVWEWVRPAVVSGLNFGPVLLLSLFAGAWAIVVAGFLRSGTRSRLLLVLAFAVCLVPTAIAADHTRIFVLCSLPGLMMLTALVLADPTVSAGEVVLIEALAWIVTPLFVWQASEGFGYVQHTGVLDLYQMFAQQVSTWTG